MSPEGGAPPHHHATGRPAIHADAPGGGAVIRRRRLLYATTSAVLAVLMGLAVLDGIGVVDAYGVDSAWVDAEGGGYRLRVHHGTVSRPGLATPFEIVVERPGGFDGPIEVAVDRDYLRIWDENGSNPSPSSETTQGRWLVWEFDPPEGDTFTWVFDARIEPAVQDGRRGAAAVLDEGVAVVQVDWSTRVLP